MSDQRELPLSASGDTASQATRYKPLVFEKTFRIAVSGDVRVTKTELEIINTKEFQRLRGVRQLGPSCLVYPTALHTRFDHSLGVLKAVDKMIISIRETQFQVGSLSKTKEENSVDITDDQRLIARLYALLHDITHVPFGHTLEDELNIFSSHDGFQKDPNHPSMKRFNHFLDEGSTVAKIIVKNLGTQIYNRFKDVFLRAKREPLPSRDGSDEFIYFLVSDTVCADLLDYVKRDAYFANIEFNLSYRFLNFLYVADGESGGRRVVVRLWKPRRHEPRRDLLTDLGALLEARYMIAERIYFHPAKIIAGTMLGRAVLEAKLAGNLAEMDMLNHSDDSLVYELRKQRVEELDNESRAKAGLSTKLANRFALRHLYKMERYIKEDFVARGDHDVDLREAALSQLRDPDGRKMIEDDIARLAGVDPGDVLIYPASLKMNSKVAEVLVRWKGKKLKLSEIDDHILQPRLRLTQDAHNSLWFIGLLYPKELSDEEVYRIKSAFEAYFLPVHERRQKFVPLVQFLAAGDDSLGAITPRRFSEGCLRIAGKLAEETVPLHKGVSTSDYIRALVQAEFANERQDGNDSGDQSGTS
jgi:HD superfamily phosphohydrolase